MARPDRKKCFEFAVAAAFAMLALMVGVAPAGACGGLVGENGTIQLVRTSTLAAYHDGIERYVTSFEFSGDGKEVGSIVPLPDVPSAVERGGSWTLQRLEREVAPPRREFAAASASLAKDQAQVLLTTTIDALDITILKGGGDGVGKWAIDHGFLLTPDAPEVLDFYAHRSPIFMAARFDAFHNDDPINHEFVVGDNALHARHEHGHEATHPPVPGEVSVSPGETGETTFTFTQPGTITYACHLPGHLAYGMTGTITIDAAQ